MIDATFIGHLFNWLLILLMPLSLGIYLTRRFQLGWRLWGIGAVTFILSQVGHIPFNSGFSALVRSGIVPLPPAPWLPLFDALWLGLSSGLWEEWSRYAAYRWWAKDARSWSRGLVMGAGHGGIEAIIVGILALLTFVNLVAYRNADLAKIFPAEQLATAQQQVSYYWSLPWYQTLIAAMERAFAIPFHLAASLLVLQAFTRRHIRWVWFSVLWHATLNAVAVYASQTWGVFASEALLGVLALFSLAIIFTLRRPDSEPLQASDAPGDGQPPQGLSGEAKPQIQNTEETSETLETTRYNS